MKNGKQCGWLAMLGVPMMLATAVQAEEVCSGRDHVKATYQVAVKSDNGAQTYPLELWRQGSQVALHYPAQEITELWEPVPGNRLHLVRYFDHYARGIEYQPSEIEGEQDWSIKRQLVSDRLMSEMTLTRTTGKGCDAVAQYELTEGKATIALQWLPGPQLVKQFEVKEGGVTRSWTLSEQVQQAEPIAQQFARWNGFNTTDYADVGDNESDPFLMKMINLGFIEHGASGFYDTHGHVLEGAGHHHH